MSIEDADDLAAFFDADEFATRAIYRAAGTGPQIALEGIFDNGFSAPNLGGFPAEAREISFRCAAAVVPAAAQGDTLLVRTVLYRVRSARPDGAGTIVLILGE